MSYRREIPRDLFNEASLLKCLGHLWLKLEGRLGRGTDFEFHGFEERAFRRFEVEQDPADGSISLANLTFSVRGVPFTLSRPLNSREAWPLWCESPFECDEDEVEVFTAEGELSPAFLQLIGADA